MRQVLIALVIADIYNTCAISREGKWRTIFCVYVRKGFISPMWGTSNASDGEHDICFIVLVDKIQRADVQNCGATVISKYAAMMSWAS